MEGHANGAHRLSSDQRPSSIAARKAVKERLRQQGVKFYKHADMLRQASEYLDQHPELYEQALARAWEMGVMEQSERLNAALFDDDRRKARAPVG